MAFLLRQYGLLLYGKTDWWRTFWIVLIKPYAFEPLLVARLVLAALGSRVHHWEREDPLIILLCCSAMRESSLLVGASSVFSLASVFYSYLSGMMLLGYFVPRFFATDSAILSAWQVALNRNVRDNSLSSWRGRRFRCFSSVSIFSVFWFGLLSRIEFSSIAFYWEIVVKNRKAQGLKALTWSFSTFEWANLNAFVSRYLLS